MSEWLDAIDENEVVVVAPVHFNVGEFTHQLLQGQSICAPCGELRLMPQVLAHRGVFCDDVNTRYEPLVAIGYRGSGSAEPDGYGLRSFFRKPLDALLLGLIEPLGARP